MDRIARKLAHHPGIVLGGAVVLGVLEFVALQRAQRASRRRRREPRPDSREAA